MKIAIVGVGLIGGSMALILKNKKFASKIIGIDLNKSHLQTAERLQIIDEAADLELGIKGADLIVIAIPVDATLHLLPKIMDLVTENQTVMDVGSTKKEILESIENHGNRRQFVATHPMWGTENSGPGNATDSAFLGKTVVIVDPENSSKIGLEKVELLYKALEMNSIYMNSKDHDIHTAYISHISHITSYALANTVLEKEKEEETIFQLASSGFSSTVRLAKSHPEMWVPIFLQNRKNVLEVLNEHIFQLGKFKKALEEKSEVDLKNLIKNANNIRGILEKK